VRLLVPTLALLVFGVAGFALVQGPGDLSLRDVFGALTDPDHSHRVLVFDSRLPRILVALLAGMALAIAGAVMQAVFQNPLASPEVMGTSLGAALGAVLAIGFGLADHSELAAPLAAFGGAVVVSFVVYVLAAQPGGASLATLLLAGLAMNTLLGALVSFATTAFAGDNFLASGPILTWLMGGLEGRRHVHALTIAVGLLGCGALLLPYVRDLDLLTLLDDAAATLGVPVARRRKMFLMLACGLTAATVAVTGGIAFVGLVIPHVARLLVGASHRALLPAAALLGALVLLLADHVCRIGLPDLGLRVGVVTSALGAPFFLLLLVRRRRELLG
jgi:iron complex transport system permease protein